MAAWWTRGLSATGWPADSTMYKTRAAQTTDNTNSSTTDVRPWPPNASLGEPSHGPVKSSKGGA
eukprot:CAMPEP_0172829858 /NCGR_PEP_ID=MMETSP1075-20121228/21823_1 /TAXON_ID=2916 /ORGANISM="Ceratium fusus, Strain PA161109" /LENGTH=63 /DNA_ID=CAMNT_0013672051 /DNA_START=61 /DNA_END=249 /DNA_ORIENTATION=-